jgi:regulator of replication initiation timing
MSSKLYDSETVTNKNYSGIDEKTQKELSTLVHGAGGKKASWDHVKSAIKAGGKTAHTILDKLSSVGVYPTVYDQKTKVLSFKFFQELPEDLVVTIKEVQGRLLKDYEPSQHVDPHAMPAGEPRYQGWHDNPVAKSKPEHDEGDEAAEADYGGALVQHNEQLNKRIQELHEENMKLKGEVSNLKEHYEVILGKTETALAVAKKSHNDLLAHTKKLAQEKKAEATAEDSDSESLASATSQVIEPAPNPAPNPAPAAAAAENKEDYATKWIQKNYNEGLDDAYRQNMRRFLSQVGDKDHRNIEAFNKAFKGSNFAKDAPAAATQATEAPILASRNPVLDPANPAPAPAPAPARAPAEPQQTLDEQQAYERRLKDELATKRQMQLGRNPNHIDYRKQTVNLQHVLNQLRIPSSYHELVHIDPYYKRPDPRNLTLIDPFQ